MAEDPYGGVSGTSWAGMSVEAIWELLKDHNSGPHREMGGAWQRSAILLENHLHQVRSYRDRLADAWPPEKSKAAYAYLERLEQLIASLEETRLAADTNKRALVSAIDAVDESKEKLARIQKEYAENRVKLQEFEKAQQETALATMDPLPTTPPVPYSRQTELEQQARNTMQSLSAELAAAQTTFIAPLPYSLRAGRENSFESLDSGGGFPATTAIVPAFSPRSLNPTKTSSASGSGGRNKVELPSNGETNPPRSNKPSTEGPILGGTKTQPPPIAGPPTTTPPSPNTLPTNTISPNTVTPGIPPTSMVPPPRASTPSGTIPPTNGGRGMVGSTNGIIGGSPSGMIGGSPTGRAGGPMGPSTRGSTAQRINPVGGMIGQDSGIRPGQRNASRREDEANRQWDPDNPWETLEGVNPVLLPSQEQRINPGPTIGGR
ncbi:hypothetical protein [Actinoplanes sp. NPDC026670]|uniref:hypothetical protein n=1 Tax=Actinoplanes sp. NPDC026670 TaxID=3154700 RepID=UPI0033E427C9